MSDEIRELLKEALDELNVAHGASGVDDKHIAYAASRIQDVLHSVMMAEEDPRYTITDLGKAYRDAMQRGAKLNGGVKAGEDKE